MFTPVLLFWKRSAVATGAASSRAAAIVLVLAGAGCTPEPEPLSIQRGNLTIDNRSTSDWQDVEIWLNDHYRVTVTSIPAGTRFTVPLNAFVAGFGQRFDTTRQSPSGIEVSVREGDDRAVKMVWGKGRRR